MAYALIGGVAVQLHSQEPRTTRDIDLAVKTYAEVPREALLRAGFEHTGRHAHSDNWLAPGGWIRKGTDAGSVLGGGAGVGGAESARG